MAKITRRTGKTDKMGGWFGAIIFGVFSLVGLFFPSPESMSPFGFDSFMGSNPMTGFFTVFKVVWVVVCGAACAYNLYMAIKGEGLSKETVDIDSNGDPLIQVHVPSSSSQTNQGQLDFEEKLRKLDALKNDGLITQTEYDHKRQQVMNEKW